MYKLTQKPKKNAGLTLMELTIVLAIIAIIGLIIVPMFLLSSDRARLRADIQSARVIQNAIEQYRIERGTDVAGYPIIEHALDRLADTGYINPRSVRIQTEHAVWVTDQLVGIAVDISDTNVAQGVHDAYHSLSDRDQAFVQGARTTP
ncbi:MAG: prepilin-type N-terminal cleavage/methylation domain-containing protein [Defluviitaleaceae bacterium]|nr:prepilin-type N-terminal cleavage/methylation domain-containing protein [Defluviitaleaceae bacterium]